MKTTAIVLAAGLSRRFGSENKLLHQIDGRAMIAVVVDEILKSQVEEVIIVTGHEHGAVLEHLPKHPKITVVQNKDYEVGMSTSIARGVDHLAADVEACMICLGDMPYLHSEDYDFLISWIEKAPDRPAILIPKYKTEKGHPVIFERPYFNLLRNLPSRDFGAREVVRNNAKQVLFVQFEHDGILRDIDFKLAEKK